MHLAAVLVALIGCVAAIAIGSRFLLAPRQATLACGVGAGDLRALTEIKGVRDITSGAVPLVVWAAAGRTALGWALIATALTPTADATIVLTNGGKLSTALDIPGLPFSSAATVPDSTAARHAAIRRASKHWLADVVRVPYVPTLGPVHPQADMPELFEAHRVGRRD